MNTIGVNSVLSMQRERMLETVKCSHLSKLNVMCQLDAHNRTLHHH